MAPGEDLKGSPRGLLIRSWGVEGLLEPEKGKTQCTLLRDHGAFIRCLWYTKYSILVHRTPRRPLYQPPSGFLSASKTDPLCMHHLVHLPFPFRSLPICLCAKAFLSCHCSLCPCCPHPLLCRYTLRSLPGAPSSECSREDPRHTCQLSASRHLHFLASPVRNLCLLTQLSLPLQRRWAQGPHSLFLAKKLLAHKLDKNA